MVAPRTSGTPAPDRLTIDERFVKAAVVHRRRQCIPRFVMLVALYPGAASAAEWFVAPEGRGRGTSSAPFGRIQDALGVAQPGDVISIRPGTYTGSFRSVRDGEINRPILLRAANGPRSVVVTLDRTVARIDHAYHVLDGLVFDGQYAAADVIRVNAGANFLIIRNAEIRRTSHDAIDIANPRGVRIEKSLIHHALNAANGRSDAHGVAAGAVRQLTIVDTEIHTFSGDAIQVDPGRAVPGWSEVTIERCRLWLAPLPAAENGFPAGSIPGENAVDTKANPHMPRARITIRDTTASGFRGGLIPNMAAFNLKENIDAEVDGVTIRDSEIGFRVRGAGGQPTGAWVTIKNALVHDVATAFRYEDNIQNLRIWNTTVGAGVRRAFEAASARRSVPDVRNLLLLGSALPEEARGPSNLAVSLDAFENVSADDYHLAQGSAAIDRGIPLPNIGRDRDGAPRPSGRGYDVGAYEWAERKRPNSQPKIQPEKRARAYERPFRPCSASAVRPIDQ